MLGCVTIKSVFSRVGVWCDMINNVVIRLVG